MEEGAESHERKEFVVSRDVRAEMNDAMNML